MVRVLVVLVIAAALGWFMWLQISASAKECGALAALLGLGDCENGNNHPGRVLSGDVSIFGRERIVTSDIANDGAAIQEAWDEYRERRRQEQIDWHNEHANW